MRAMTKTILFSRTEQGKTVEQHPVGVFASGDLAKQYAVLINTAHQSGNVDLARQLDKNTSIASDGTLVPGVRFSLAEVPYNPTLAASADDLFAPAQAPAA